jgi:hypothetical protein
MPINFKLISALSSAAGLVAIVILSLSQSTLAQTTAITYQGRLTVSGVPANGNYDFRFTLFASQGGGDQIGSSISSVLPAINGAFTAQLDFGDLVFPGADRFLRIEVRNVGSSNYNVLSPRQQLTSAPYTIRSSFAGTASLAANTTLLGGVPASGYIQNTTGTQSATNFNISGNGTAGGTLSAGILNATTELDIGANRVLSAPATQNLFATVVPGNITTSANGGSNSYFGYGAGPQQTTGGGNAFFGNAVGARISNGGENAFFGNVAGTSTNSFYNSFFGDAVGFSNSSGTSNSYFGKSAGLNRSIGTKNVFFGFNAGSSANGQDGNTFVGANAGFNAQQATNTFIGYGAGQNNANAQNTFVGANAGSANSGVDNTFIGYNAGVVNSTGNFNVFISGGGGNTTGSFNVFAGGGNNNTTGSSNTFFGFQSGGNNTTGGSNIFIGNNAGNPNTGTQVSNSIAIGAGVTVSINHTIAIGTAQDSTQIPGNLAVGSLSVDNVTVAGTAQVNLGTTNVLQVINNDPNTPRGFIADHLYFREFYTLHSNNHLCFQAAPVGYGISACSAGNAPSRYKSDSAPFVGGLELINRLNPTIFRSKEGGRQDVGLNADEVAAVEPRLVNNNDKGEVEGVKNVGLSVVFVNAFKEQQAQIQEQELQIAMLKKMVCAGHPGADVCK